MAETTDCLLVYGFVLEYIVRDYTEILLQWVSVLTSRKSPSSASPQKSTNCHFVTKMDLEHGKAELSKNNLSVIYHTVDMSPETLRRKYSFD